MGGDNINQDGLPFLFAPGIKQDLLPAEVGMPSPEGGAEGVSNFDKYFWNDFGSYVGAIGYSLLETYKASPEVFNPNYVEGYRATEGVRALFDQNIGDGTITAITYVGADVALKAFELVATKLGAKEFNPTIRFLTSVGLGVLVSGWLETTTRMGNVVDIPGDWFGVGLGALSILTMRWLQENATHENIEELFRSKKTKKEKMTLLQLDAIVDANLDRQQTSEDVPSAAEALAQRMITTLGVQDRTE